MAKKKEHHKAEHHKEKHDGKHEHHKMGVKHKVAAHAHKVKGPSKKHHAE